MVTVISLLPSVAYLMVLALAVMFEVYGPAAWFVEETIDGPWGIPLLWLLALGGPIISVIGSLILQLPSDSGQRHGGVVGLIAWVLLLMCLISCLPFPWIFLVAAD